MIKVSNLRYSQHTFI